LLYWIKYVCKNVDDKLKFVSCNQFWPTSVNWCQTCQATNKKIVKADVYVAGLWINIFYFISSVYLFHPIWWAITWWSTACDVPGIKRLIPSQWREWDLFDNIYKLVGVPVVTVQLRYNGWVTELQDLEKSR